MVCGVGHVFAGFTAGEGCVCVMWNEVGGVAWVVGSLGSKCVGGYGVGCVGGYGVGGT